MSMPQWLHAAFKTCVHHKLRHKTGNTEKFYSRVDTIVLGKSIGVTGKAQQYWKLIRGVASCCACLLKLLSGSRKRGGIVKDAKLLLREIYIYIYII